MAPRISFMDPVSITDEVMLPELDRLHREGTPQSPGSPTRPSAP
jgi:hypothetical protein